MPNLYNLMLMRNFLFFALAPLIVACTSAGPVPVERTSLEKMSVKGPVETMEIVSFPSDEGGEFTHPNPGATFLRFDRNGMLAEMQNIGPGGEVRIRHTYKYDEYNGETEQVSVMGEHESKIITERRRGVNVGSTFTNDGKHAGHIGYEKVSGQVDKYMTYLENGELWSTKTITKTSELDYTTEEIHSAGEVPNWFRTNVEDGLQTRVEAGRGDVVEHTDVTTYDADGNPVRATSTEGGETEEVYMKYEYDGRGNWIKQTVYDAATDKPVSLVERTIKYYG